MRSKYHRHRRFRFEPLEPRLMLAITVDTLLDEFDGSIFDGDISLRDAIAAAEAGETIDFAVNGTITLTLGELLINQSLIINGPGAELLTIDASGGDPTPGAIDGEGHRVMHVDGDSQNFQNVEVRGLTLTGGDTAEQRGGAIYSLENLIVENCTITGNAAGEFGGGISTVSGTLNVIGSLVSGNFANLHGGGIDSHFSTVNILASTISGNSAGTRGGGLSFGAGLVNVAESEISGNHSYYGGGIWSYGTLTVEGTTISGNSASISGGGIGTNSSLTVVNSTLSGNMANHNGGGIALYLAPTGASIQHSTITGNTADFDADAASSGGGIYAADFEGGGPLQIANSIIAGNFDHSGIAPDLDLTTQPPAIVDLRYSLVGDGTGSGRTPAPSGGPDGDGNLIGSAQAPIDPLLGPLADNGGPTFTRLLLRGSPAIDAGDPNFAPPPDFDQRGSGFPRVVGGRIDMGAVEMPNSDPVIESLSITSPIDEGGTTTLSGIYDDLDSFDTHEIDIDWNGDGIYDQTVSVAEGAFNVDHQYFDDNPAGVPDTFSVGVRVRDSAGGAGTASVAMTVNNVPPTLSISGAPSVDEGAVYTLNLSASDPGLDTISQWTIDWGDGIETFSGNPTAVTHTYADGDATYVISATATDEDGTHVASNTVSVTVHSLPIPRATLTNGLGDATVSITVDATGWSDTGDFDPVGNLVREDAIFASWIAIRYGDPRQTLALHESVANAQFTFLSDQLVISEFTIDSFRFEVTQSLIPLLKNGVRVGTQLVQSYTITNSGPADAEFDLFRYLDGDLPWRPGRDDNGGRQVIDGQEILYETDRVDATNVDATYLGITVTGGQSVTQARYEIGHWSTLKDKILAGGNLTDTVIGDTNGDGVIDNPSVDIALAFRNHFLLSPGAQQTYVTTTIFGTGDVNDDPPPPATPKPVPQPTPTPVDVPLLPSLSPPSLLLVSQQAVPLAITSAEYGTAGIYLPPRQASAVSGGTPQAVDAALANDEVNEAFLLAGFLDFVDPEMLVVDLGDEPPARVASDSAKMSPANQDAPAEQPDDADDRLAAKSGSGGPGKLVESMKPPADTAGEPHADGISASLPSLVTNNWRWFATAAAALLLGGATWKSRSAWLHAARKMWSR